MRYFYSGIPPNGHPVITVTSLLRQFFSARRKAVTNTHDINLLLRSSYIFSGLEMARFTRFHCSWVLKHKIKSCSFNATASLPRKFTKAGVNGQTLTAKNVFACTHKKTLVAEKNVSLNIIFFWGGGGGGGRYIFRLNTLKVPR